MEGLEEWPAQAKQVLALQLANKHFRDELANARLELKGVSKVNNDHKKQIGNQLEAKHELRLKLAKTDLKKHCLSLSRDHEKKESAMISSSWKLQLRRPHQKGSRRWQQPTRRKSKRRR
jgi:hypothetical protein